MSSSEHAEARMGNIIGLVGGLVGILSLVLSVFALQQSQQSNLLSEEANRLAARANQISTDQMVEHPVVLEVRGAGGVRTLNGSDSPFQCSQRLRIYNSGGAAASIVGYTVSFTLEGRSVTVTSSGASSAARPWDEVARGITGFEALLLDRSPQNEHRDAYELQEHQLHLPHQISPFTAEDIYAVVWFRWDNTAYESFWPPIQYVTSPPEDALPLEVEYVLHTASGNSFSSTKLPIGFFRRR
jgi:hypothetical protein